MTNDRPFRPLEDLMPIFGDWMKEFEASLSPEELRDWEFKKKLAEVYAENVADKLEVKPFVRSARR